MKQKKKKIPSCETDETCGPLSLKGLGTFRPFGLSVLLALLVGSKQNVNVFTVLNLSSCKAKHKAQRERVSFSKLRVTNFKSIVCFLHLKLVVFLSLSGNR